MRTRLGALLTILCLTDSARAQIPESKVKPAEPADPISRPVFHASVSLAVNAGVDTKLVAVRDYIGAGAWKSVAGVLQDVLDQPEDSFVPLRRLGPGGEDRTRWVSARSEAERLLGSLPAAGRESYEVQFGARAASLLAEAGKRGDSHLLAEVARRYFFTRAGAEAAELLGTHYLDRSRYHLAALCFDRILQRADAGRLAPLTLFKAVLAYRRGGQTARGDQTWKLLIARAPNGIRLGERQVGLAELQKALARSQPAAAASRDWTLFRGSPSRSAGGDATALSPASHWRIDTLLQPFSASWINSAEQQLQMRRLPSLCGFTPVAVGNRIVYRSYDALHAVDLKTGQREWDSVRLFGGLDSLAEPPSYPHVSGWVANYLNQGAEALVENTVIGTLSSDGRRVFAVEDLAVPPFDYGIWTSRPGPTGSRLNYADELSDGLHRSRLVAVDLDTGKVAWEQGGRAGPKGRLLDDAFFLGPPLPLDGKLYTLVEKDQDLRLVCLNPATGAVSWMQTLAMFKTPLTQDPGRRTRAAHLAAADGVLVCPTNAGAVIAVDLLTHTLLWSQAYAEDPPPALPPPIPGRRPPIRPRGMMLPRLNSTWRMPAPIIADGKVLINAPDEAALHCLSLRDGSLLWKIERRPDDLYLAGVSGNKILLVGQEQCRALDLANGKELWTCATGMPSGMGALVGEAYLLPLRTTGNGGGPALWLLHVASGEVRQRLALPPGETAGNLILHDGEVISQTAARLAAFAPKK